MKRAVHHTRRWHGRATAAEARKKKRRKKKTVPRVAIGGRHFCLLAVFPARFHGYCSHRSPVIIVLTLVWLFPSCHAITCRELACCTSRIPRTCPRPTQRRASVLIWPQKNQWIRPFFFSFLFFLSLSWYFHQLHQLQRFIFFLPFLRLSLFLSLSRSFFFSPSIYPSIYLSGFVGIRLFASLFPRFLRMAGFGERTTLPPLNTANAFMNMHRDDPVQPGWMLAVESDMLARNRFISWYLIPLYTSQGQEGRETGRECSRLSLTFALETSSEVDSATSFRIGKLGSGEDFGLGFEEFPIRDRCCVIT